MTENRVMFTLDGLALYRTDMKAVLSSVFGLYHRPQTKSGDQIEAIDIVCRLDQFAQFIIMRNDIGLPNNIKGLQAKIISDPSLPPRRIFNVSEHKNKEPSDDN